MGENWVIVPTVQDCIDMWKIKKLVTVIGEDEYGNKTIYFQSE